MATGSIEGYGNIELSLSYLNSDGILFRNVETRDGVWSEDQDKGNYTMVKGKRGDGGNQT